MSKNIKEVAHLQKQSFIIKTIDDSYDVITACSSNVYLKYFISGGSESDLYFVMCKTSEK